MARCPEHADGVHQLGGGTVCACGYEMKLSNTPFCVSIEVSDGAKMYVNEAFNCSSLDMAVDALRAAADKLEGETDG
jgi:hypothetical protein